MVQTVPLGSSKLKLSPVFFLLASKRTKKKEDVPKETHTAGVVANWPRQHDSRARQQLKSHPHSLKRAHWHL